MPAPHVTYIRKSVLPNHAGTSCAALDPTQAATAVVGADNGWVYRCDFDSPGPDGTARLTPFHDPDHKTSDGADRSHDNTVWTVEYAHDGKTVASASAASSAEIGSVKTWDPRDRNAKASRGLRKRRHDEFGAFR